MLLAAHLILTAYGFWLPNDPQGSGSDYVRSKALYTHGPATKVAQRVQRDADPCEVRAVARDALRYAAVRFTGEQARAVAQGFAAEAEQAGVTVYACAVLPDHAHLVVGRHERDFRMIAGRMKAAATRRLTALNLHPLAMPADGGEVPSPWARRPWVVFKDSAAAVRGAIAYVEANPVKAGLPVQRWSFVRAWCG